MRKVLLAAFMGLSALSFGQQMPQFSQYQRNQQLFNPGAAGMYDFFDITLGGRMQWLGFDNAPMTTYLYASTTLTKKPKVRYNPALRTSNGPIRNPEVKTGKLKHGVGGMLMVDQYGAFRQLKGALTYALHIPLSDEFNMSFGANVGMSNRAFLQDRAQTLNMMDPSMGYTDDTYDAYANNASTNTLDLGAGLYFYSKKFFGGIAAEQLSRDAVSFGGSQLANFDPNIHYNVTMGYKFMLNDNLSLQPSVLAKFMPPTPVSLEASLQLEYKEWLWFALSYRQGLGGFNNTDAVIAMAGLNISERFKFGYSFDYSISEFNQYSSGGHELMLGLMLGR